MENPLPELSRHEQHERLAREDLHDHEEDARRHRPFERRFQNVCVDRDRPDDDRKANDRDWKLPGGIVGIFSRKPRRGDPERRDDHLIAEHCGGGLKKALAALHDAHQNDVPQECEANVDRQIGKPGAARQREIDRAVDQKISKDRDHESRRGCRNVLRTAPKQCDLGEEPQKLVHVFLQRWTNRIMRAMDCTVITAQPALDALARDLRGAGAIALDTEFLRERTYRAQLCLLQVATADLAVCVDPLAGLDFSVLTQAFGAAGPVKVMHAARQDLEVMLEPFGLVQPIFDTQVAAALTGFAAQVGYAELVKRCLGHELSKAQTRTDWSRRPLSPDQIEYALDDVRYLLPLKNQLTEK